MTKHLDRIKSLFEKSPVVRFSDIERIVRDGKKTDYAKQLVNMLVKQGKIFRITKGYYTKISDS
jgi:hypothetical protein